MRRGKDYYKILGADPQDDQNGIRAAYRSRAKQCHPDKAGPAGKQEFQDVAEAYETLSHPEKRRVYDEQSRAERPSRFMSRSAVEFEPTQPEQRYEFEVFLTPEEARFGARFSLRIEKPHWCSVCDGALWRPFFPCPACGRRSTADADREIHIHLPPLRTPRAVFEAVVPDHVEGAVRVRLFVTVGEPGF